jgi:hypothetical protein
MQTAPRQITLESAAKQGITLGKALYFKTNQAFSQTAVIWNWHKQMPSGLAADMRRAIAQRMPCATVSKLEWPRFSKDGENKCKRK